MNKARILFVFSTDYGEIVNADLFCKDQGFDVIGLFPEKNAKSDVDFCQQKHYFQNAQQILDLVIESRPHLVVLASAYLLVINNVLDQTQLIHLISELKQYDCCLATTDPWMGYWRNHQAESFNIHGIKDTQSRKAVESKIRSHQAELDHFLDDVWHLYATAYVDPVRHSFSFFNRVSGFNSLPEKQDQVTLVLSNHDYTVQLRKYDTQFHLSLIRYINDVLQTTSSDVVLLIPHILFQQLKTALDNKRIKFLGRPDLSEFRTTIMSSRLVLYWNLVSASLLYAYYAKCHVAFLDIGHQAELGDGFKEYIVQNVYQGIEPVYESLEASVVGKEFSYLEETSSESPAGFVAAINAAQRVD